MSPRAILFDFDGTLADSYTAITASVNHVRSRHGQAPLLEDEVRPHVGRGLLNLLQDTVPGLDADADAEHYRAHHPSVLKSGTSLLPGAAETVDYLHQAGLKLAICSNKPRRFTSELLVHFGLDDRFDAVIGPEDVARIKPAPDMILAALDRLGVIPEESLYVGDMTIDVRTARAAGVSVWVVPTGSDELATLEASRPDRILRELFELIALFCPDE